MKKYIGTKEVKAQPMTADEAVKKGYKVGNHEHEDGYEIQYADGYTSWSPKKVFEDSYRCSETFADRLVIEQRDLDSKLEKLSSFLDSEKFAELGSDSRILLKEQHGIMCAYSRVLNERINNAKKYCHA